MQSGFEWTQLLNEDATPKTPEDITTLLADCGVKPKDNFVLYSTMATRSGYTTMILGAVGFEKVRNYEASIYQWSARQNELPMETGI